MVEHNQIARVRDYIDKMPSLPTTVTKILEICNNPRTSPADLNKVISLDPVLMGKVMKLINSAYYGLSQKVTSLVRAIIMLGINTVKNLALSTAVLGSLGDSRNFQALNMEGFWRHSLCVGVTAKKMAKKLKIGESDLEEYFIAGLLHDIGKIPLNNRLSEGYVRSMGYSDMDRIPLFIAEKETMGIDHGETGRLIVENWKLGPALRDAVAYHHSVTSYEGENKTILYTVHLANYFANTFEIGFAGDRYPQKTEEMVFEHLGISIDDLEEIEESVNSEIEKASIFLKLTV
ncbi:MAG: HDOD domain-containing protein [Spirochaetes bacterium]|nr:MAG: HDOD domain-containing protein [Spirochaetota bacterium]